MINHPLLVSSIPETRILLGQSNTSNGEPSSWWDAYPMARDHWDLWEDCHVLAICLGFNRNQCVGICNARWQTPIHDREYTMHLVEKVQRKIVKCRECKETVCVKCWIISNLNIFLVLHWKNK